MLIATSGTNVVAVDANAAQTPIACILDSADSKPITAIAPGELLSLFGEFSSGKPTTPPPGQVSTTLGGVTIEVNGIPSALLYAGGEQINFQAPFGIAGTAQANIQFASAFSDLSDSQTLPIVASNPTAFLDTATPSPALATCTMESSASVSGLPAAGLQRGWLSQHLSESGRPRFGCVAVSQRTGSDRTSRRHSHNATDGGRSLGSAGRDRRRLGGEPPDTAWHSRGRSPGFAYGWRRAGTGCQSGYMGAVKKVPAKLRAQAGDAAVRIFATNDRISQIIVETS